VSGCQNAQVAIEGIGDVKAAGERYGYCPRGMEGGLMRGTIGGAGDTGDSGAGSVRTFVDPKNYLYAVPTSQIFLYPTAIQASMQNPGGSQFLRLVFFSVDL